MATWQFSTTLRNGFLDQLDSVPGSYQTLIIYSGSLPSNAAAADTGTPLVEFDLQQPSWNAASGGQKSLADIAISVGAIATGTAGYFRIWDGAVGVCHIQGDITTTGGGGAMTSDSLSITSGQTINLTQFILIAPGA